MSLDHWYYGAPKHTADSIEKFDTDIQNALLNIEKGDSAALQKQLKSTAFRNALEAHLKTNLELLDAYMHLYGGAEFRDWRRWIDAFPTEAQRIKNRFRETYDISYETVAQTFAPKYAIPVFPTDRMTLEDAGVETIRILGDNEIPVMMQRFRDTEPTFPEFVEGAKPYVLGGFAAYANPSSYHNALVKHLRRRALDAVQRSGIFERYVHRFYAEHASEYKVEVLFDRMMHRWPDQSPTEESAHRDVTPAVFARVGDVIFGGWINITDKTQYFVAWPSSHLNPNGEAYTTLDVASAYKGFSSIDTSSKEYMHFQVRKRLFAVPPGHMVVFPQHIIHEVLSNVTHSEQFRLFTGWRLTKSGQLLDEAAKRSVMDHLETPRLPSNQLPNLYGKNHQTIFMNKSFAWTGDKTGPSGSVHDWWNKNIRDVVRTKTPITPNLSSLDTYFTEDEIKAFRYSEEDRNIMLQLHRLHV